MELYAHAIRLGIDSAIVDSSRRWCALAETCFYIRDAVSRAVWPPPHDAR